MPTTASADRVPESKRIGGAINIAFTNGEITDALIAGNTTVTALKTALLANPAVRSERIPAVILLNEALDRGVSNGWIPATHGVTTVAGLLALTDAPNAAYRQGYVG